MNKKKYSLILILFILFSLFNNMYFVKTKNVDYIYDIKIWTDKDYGIIGDKIQIGINTRYSTVNLKIYNPNYKIVLDKLIMGNTSFFLTIKENSTYGEYKMIAKGYMGNYCIKYFTIIDNSNWVESGLPYIFYHKNMEYIFENWKMNINYNDENMYIDFFGFKKIINHFNMNKIIYHNDMGFKLCAYKNNYFINMTFHFIYGGCKFIISGEFDKERNVTINLDPKKIKKQLNGFRTKHIIFDISDIKKILNRIDYNNENGTLNILIPKSFELDPYIYLSGFESGDLSEWDSIIETGSSNITVVNNITHHGYYSAMCSFFGGLEQCNVRKNIEDYDTTYIKLNILFKTLPSNNEWYSFAISEDYDDDILSEYYIYNDNGDYKLGAYAYSDATEYNSDPLTFNINIWYCIKIKTIIGDADGEFLIWLDDVNVLNESGIDNKVDSDMYVNHYRFGNYLSSDDGIFYMDCIIINNDDISCESMDVYSRLPNWNNYETIIDNFENESLIQYKFNMNINTTLGYIKIDEFNAETDFTLWTEVDPESKMTQTKTTSEWLQLKRGEGDSKLYLDEGVGQISKSLNWTFIMNITDVEAGDGSNRDLINPFVISNNINAVSNPKIYTTIAEQGSNDDVYYLQIAGNDGLGGSGSDTSVLLNANIAYYCNYIRNNSGKTSTLIIRTGNHSGVLIDKIAVTINGMTMNFRYMFFPHKSLYVGDDTDWSSGYIEYLKPFSGFGIFYTVNYLNDINGVAVTLLTNATIPSNTYLTVEFSNDNVSWCNHNNIINEYDNIIMGFESTDLRDLNYSTIYMRFNSTSLNLSDTSILNQIILIYVTEESEIQYGESLIILGLMIGIIIGIGVGLKK